MPPQCAAMMAARRGAEERKKTLSLRKALALNHVQIMRLFREWDEDGDGNVSQKEFRNAMPMLGIKASRDEIDELFDSLDPDGSGSIEYDELRDLLESEANRKELPQSPLLARHDDDSGPPVPKGRCGRARHGACGCAKRLLDFLNTVTLQTLLYFMFVCTFQLLTESLRLKEEYFLDRTIADTFIENHFDSSHNTFESVRRTADIWEWGNNVLWPGLFGNAGPCDGDRVGTSAKTCNDDAWPDGTGSFHLDGATPWTVAELVTRMDMLDWTDGLQLRTARITPEPADDCAADLLGSHCYPELGPNARSDTAPFGFNYTHPSSPLEFPWRYFTPEELGSNPDGQFSANLASFRNFEAGGFVAIVLPFFSTEHLAEQRGTAEQIVDFRETRVTRGSGRTARFACVRLSWNGEQIHQLCDPNGVGESANRTTGVVRAAVERFWNEMKRAHFVDDKTRAVTLTMDVRSNHLGVRSRVTYMWEITSLGAVLPSYDMETRVEAESQRWATRFYLNIGLGFCGFFVVLELIELIESGPFDYFSNMWNIMDWLNFIIFFFVWWMLRTMFQQEEERECAMLCETVGYQDDWQVLNTARQAKFFLSLCVCIQLLKIIKFTNAIVPKMSLATAVLSKGLADLIFFGLVFGISMFAFSVMFYVQLGPVMEGFNDQLASFISLARALFGDFDIDEIMNNSRGYTNAILFLVYLFVAVFILLSMFLAILGESQAAVRSDQDDEKEAGTAPPEYGVLHHAGVFLRKAQLRLLHRARKIGGMDDGDDDGMPTAPAEDTLKDTMADMRGELQAIQRQFVRLAKEKAAEMNPNASPAAKGVSGPLDYNRMVKILEERLVPTMTRSIVVELEQRGGARRRKGGGGGGGGGAGGSPGDEQARQPHQKRRPREAEHAPAPAEGAGGAQLIAHGKRRGSNRHMLHEHLADQPLERVLNKDWTQEPMAC